MEVAPDRFRALVRMLAPLLLERSRRNFYLEMAFPGQPRFRQIAPDIQEASLYAQQLLTFLIGADALPGGEEPLLVYLETMRDAVGGDRAAALAELLAALRAEQGAAPPAADSVSVLPDSATLRQLLSAAFSDEELTTLCWDHFRPVYESFGSGMSKGHKIQRLIEHCERAGETERLLALVRAARPAQYHRFLA